MNCSNVNDSYKNCLKIAQGQKYIYCIAYQLLAVSAEVGADEGGLEEGGAGSRQYHLVRPDAVGGGVISASNVDMIYMNSCTPMLPMYTKTTVWSDNLTL